MGRKKKAADPWASTSDPKSREEPAAEPRAEAPKPKDEAPKALPKAEAPKPVEAPQPVEAPKPKAEAPKASPVKGRPAKAPPPEEVLVEYETKTHHIYKMKSHKKVCIPKT